mmetsp:Transcript_99887/g.308153  ORF Transcript_99887/g.308153 Transcript_99887/m.308153 type:complete len:239 (-) Transcript_99887:89-805(-)
MKPRVERLRRRPTALGIRGLPEREQARRAAAALQSGVRTLWQAPPPGALLLQPLSSLLSSSSSSASSHLPPPDLAGLQGPLLLLSIPDHCLRPLLPAQAHPRGLQLLCWGWECAARPLLEHHGLVVVGHVLVHHGAVPVALDVCRQALVRTAPADTTDLLARDHPLAKALEDLPEGRGLLRADEVDEGVAQAGVRLEVHGQVHEIVLPREALRVEQRQEHGAGVVVGQVPQHHRCARP